MKHLSIISITVLTLLLLSTSAMAWSNCKTKRCNADGKQTQQENRVERMAIMLDLSEEQQKQMAELRTAQQQQRAQMRTDLKEAHAQLRSSQPDAEIDTEDLKTAARTYADLKAAMLVNKIEHKQQMFSILTPEQQEKAAKLKAMHSQCGKKDQCNKGNCCATCTNCKADCCPKSFHKGKGCNGQSKKAAMDCGKQSPCMKSRCR
ncbi:MAG: Spy/CpxP family protein refolding chaperone [Desulfuromonadaceae bacterium]